MRRHERVGGILLRDLSPFVRWVHDAELKTAAEQGNANASRINHNVGVN